MEVSLASIIIFLFTVALVLGTASTSSVQEEDRADNTVFIDMPIPESNVYDDYICRGWKVDNHQELYLVDIKPLRIPESVHHLTLYGCWAGITHTRTGCRTVCAPGTGHVLFVWARDTPDIHFPRGDAETDVGFRIGFETTIQFLIVQVHFGQPTEKLNDGAMRLILTTTRPPLVAGILIQSISNVTIPARSENANVDITCSYNEDIDLHVFAYKMHTHSLGQSIASYKVNDSWHLMAYGSPQWLEAFYPLRNHFDIKKGDYLVTRCNYNASSRDRDTKFGFTASDEMCNIYLMYYTNVSSVLPHVRQFLDCHGDNVPELAAKIPSTGDLRMDHRQNHHANGEYHDVRGQESVEEGSAVDENAPQYSRRRNGFRNNKLLTSHARASSRYLADESTDAAGSYEFERQPQRNRNRQHFSSSNSEYPIDSKADNDEQPGSVPDDFSKQQKDDAETLAPTEVALSSYAASAAPSVKETVVKPTAPTASATSSSSTSTSMLPQNTSLSSPVGVHQSVKKGGVGVPHLSIDSNVDELSVDTIEENAKQPSIMGASVIISMLIIVPLTIVIVVTICSRLRKKGVCTFGFGKKRSRHLNLGNLLSRGQRNGGFRQLNGACDEEYRAELLDPVHSEDESEVEEFSNTPTVPRKA